MQHCYNTLIQIYFCTTTVNNNSNADKQKMQLMINEMTIKSQVNKQIKKTDFSISDKNCDVNETKPPPLPLSFSCRKGYLKEVKNNQGIVMSTKKVLLTLNVSTIHRTTEKPKKKRKKIKYLEVNLLNMWKFKSQNLVGSICCLKYINN